MNKIRIFFVVVLFISLTYLIYRLINKSEKEVNFENNKNFEIREPQMQFTNPYIKEVDEKGNILWEFKADFLKFDKTKKIAYLSGIEGNIYEDKRISLFLKAENLTIDLNTKNFSMINAEGERKQEKLYLKAGKIKFDARNKKISFSRSPYLRKGGIEIRCNYMEADAGVKVIKFKGNTKTTIE